MKHISFDSNTKTVTIELSLDELNVLKNGLNEICNGPHAIYEEEFDTRVGMPLKQAFELLKSSSSIVNSLDESYRIIKD